MQIAVLDNDHQQADVVRRTLTDAGYICETFASDVALRAYLDPAQATLLIVGVGVGDAMARPFTAQDEATSALPTLLIVERHMEAVVLAEFDRQIVDYIVKPLRGGELVMRIRILAGRAFPELAGQTSIHFGDHTFDLGTRNASVAGRQVDLTQKEFELALLFFRNINRPLSRAYILESIWARDADIPSRTVDTHVSRIRSKLELRPERGLRLVPVYSFGYRLERLAG